MSSKAIITCFVPGCMNTSLTAPKKIFFSLPANIERRKNWLNAINRNNYVCRNSKKNICEDHFDLETDSVNYLYHKLVENVRLRLKPDVVPHKFICETPEKFESQLKDINEIRLRNLEVNIACIAPRCENNEKTAPDKCYFNIPSDEKIRQKWEVAMNKKICNTQLESLRVCEEHFDLEKDTEYDEKTDDNPTGNLKLKLKSDAVPHKFLYQPTVKHRPRELKQELVTTVYKMMLIDGKYREVKLENNVYKVLPEKEESKVVKKIKLAKEPLKVELIKKITIPVTAKNNFKRFNNISKVKRKSDIYNKFSDKKPTTELSNKNVLTQSSSLNKPVEFNFSSNKPEVNKSWSKDNSVENKKQTTVLSKPVKLQVSSSYVQCKEKNKLPSNSFTCPVNNNEEISPFFTVYVRGAPL